MNLEEILAALESLDTLDQAGLEALRDSIVTLYDEVRDSDLTEADLAALEELNTARQTVVARIAEVEAEAAAREDRLAAMDAEMHPDGDGEAAADDAAVEPGDGEADGDGTDDGDGEAASEEEDPADVDAEEAGDRQPVLAGAGTRTALRRLDTLRGRQPSSARTSPNAGLGRDVVLAAADVPGFSAGTRIQTRDDFGRVLAERNRSIQVVPQPGQGYLKFPVMQVRREFDATHFIPDRRAGDAEFVTELLENVQREHIQRINESVASMGNDVVLAAGGPCAPCERDFTVDFVGTNVTPFSAAFASVRYPRASVCYYPPFCFDDTFDPSAEIGRVITQAEDEAGYGDGATDPKGCVRIDCPSDATCDLDIVIKCVTIGNWIDRAFPEYVRAWRQAVDVLYARRYEQKHIAEVVAGSTILTGHDPVFGAAIEYTSQVLQVIAYENSCRRLPAGQQWHLTIPSWFVTYLKIDLMRYMGATNNGIQGLNVTDAQVVALLRSMGVNVSTYIDESGPTTQGDDQLLACLAAGAIPDLPNSVRSFLYPEGAWVRGNGGELTVGLIRDSGTIFTNDFQSFSEEWTKMCFRGCSSFVLDIPLCPSGLTGGTVQLDCAPDLG